MLNISVRTELQGRNKQVRTLQKGAEILHCEQTISSKER